MDRGDLIDRLQLDEDFPLDHQVGPEALADGNVLVDDWDGDLAADVKPAILKIIGQDGLVDRLQQAGAEPRMHLDRGVQDLS